MRLSLKWYTKITKSTNIKFKDFMLETILNLLGLNMFSISSSVKIEISHPSTL